MTKIWPKYYLCIKYEMTVQIGKIFGLPFTIFKCQNIIFKQAPSPNIMKHETTSWKISQTLTSDK